MPDDRNWQAYSYILTGATIMWFYHDQILFGPVKIFQKFHKDFLE